MIQLRKMHLGNIRDLSARTAGELMEASSSRIPEVSWQHTDDTRPGPISGRSLARQFVVDSTTMAVLKDSTREQINTETEFESTLFLSILTPIQVARAIVQSYPMVPDALALCNGVPNEEE